MLDTVLDSLITQVLDGGATFISGTGSDGETQAVLTPSETQDIQTTISDGSLSLDIALPAGTGLAFQGMNDIAPEQLGAFLNSVIDSYIPANLPPESPAAQTAQSLKNAVADLISTLQDLGVTNVVVRVVDFMSLKGATNSALAPNEIVFDAGASAGSQVFAMNLASLDPTKTVVLKNVESAVLSGSGSVRVEGDVGARITSDNRAQKIVGGGGADTLVGGGGNDTLTGGVGDDTFGFGSMGLGHYTVTDFDKAHDKIGFNIPGVTNVAQLTQLVTGVEQTAQGVTYHFGPDASITLVGVSAADLTSDMIKFNF